MGGRKIRAFSAGVVPVRLSPEGPRVLLLRAYRHWDFPKGGVEAGESPLDAATREVEEETGITDLEFVWGHEFIDTGPYGPGKVSRYYAALTQEQHVVLGINPQLGRPEHHEFRWFSLDGAAERLTPRVLCVLQWTERFLSDSPLSPPRSAEST
ncbi:MAG: NUDIX domain-containing protein [Pseudomonadota bacterium]